MKTADVNLRATVEVLTPATSSIWVTFTVTGFHRWPDAGGDRAYLAARHRHRFGYRVEIPAPVDDARTIEFHDLIDVCMAIVGPEGGGASCETLAANLGARLLERYTDLPWVLVTVDEDGECGATVRTVDPSAAVYVRVAS